MHCFISYSDYTDGFRQQIVSLMKARLDTSNVLCLVTDDGYHIYSYISSYGNVVFNIEESITPIQRHKVGETHIQSIP